MQIIDLFAGIGGFSLAGHRAGFETVLFCEIEPFQRKVLEKNFKGIPIHDDITTLFDSKSYIDENKKTIITAGFPCQDISVSGKGAGIDGQMSGLWSEAARIIREVRPEYAIIENSPNLTNRGLEKVLCDLSEIGYNAEWECLSAKTFGGQHARKRLYLVAYPDKKLVQGCSVFEVLRIRLLQEPASRISPGWKNRRDIPQPRNFRSTNDLPYIVDRIKSLGNSIVPEIPYQIFMAIKEISYNTPTENSRRPIPQVIEADQ